MVRRPPPRRRRAGRFAEEADRTSVVVRDDGEAGSPPCFAVASAVRLELARSASSLESELSGRRCLIVVWYRRSIFRNIFLSSTVRKVRSSSSMNLSSSALLLTSKSPVSTASSGTARLEAFVFIRLKGQRQREVPVPALALLSSLARCRRVASSTLPALVLSWPSVVIALPAVAEDRNRSQSPWRIGASALVLCCCGSEKGGNLVKVSGAVVSVRSISSTRVSDVWE